VLKRALIQALMRFFHRFTAGGSVLARVCLWLAAATLLQACSTAGPANDGSLFNNRCMAERADIVQAANWDNVQPHHVRIINGEIRPMVLYLEENRPYILKIKNADRTDHNMWSPDFFKNGVAIDSVQFGNKAPTKGCVNGIRIKARSTVTIRLIPVWEGRYQVYNSGSFLHLPTGPDAVVNIILPRVGIAAK